MLIELQRICFAGSGRNSALPPISFQPAGTQKDINGHVKLPPGQQ